MNWKARNKYLNGTEEGGGKNERFELSCVPMTNANKIHSIGSLKMKGAKTMNAREGFELDGG